MRRLRPLFFASFLIPSFWGACSPGLAISDDAAGAGPEDGAGGRPGSSGGRLGATGGQAESGGASASGGKSSSSGGASSSVGGRTSGSGGAGGAGSCGECPKYASCVGEGDEARCECDEGFEEDGGACVDIDECEEDDPCGPNAICENARGSYKCSCEPGFVRDGETCVPRIRLASVSLTNEAGNAYSQYPAISADGRFVSFHGEASDLVPGDTNDTHDVFVFDRQTGEVSRVSVNSAGEEGNSWSTSSSLSGDGRYVVFSSYANNLVADDTNGELDVFRHDRETGQTIRVSLAHDGSELQGGQDYSAFPTISADGNRVTFNSFASNLVPDDTNDSVDQFLRDIEAGTTIRVNLHNDGSQSGSPTSSLSFMPHISGNGRYVVFASLWSGFGGATDSYADIYRRDLQNNVTEYVSYPVATFFNDGSSAAPSISRDGRYVVFHSSSSTLVPDDENGVSDVFIRDLNTGVIERVSVTDDGQEANDASYASFQRSVSSNGRYVVFMSFSTNLVEGDTNQLGDVFVRDRVLKRTIRVSVGPRGEEGDGHSSDGTISDDGKTVAFYSTSQTFGVETEGRGQIWVYDLRD